MSIRIRKLNHTYDPGTPYETKALVDINLDIQRGEFIGLIGHTGSGKSTLIQQLNGLLKPQTGQIVINGYDITAKGIRLSDIRKRVGLVFQYPEYQLFEETVLKDVSYGPQNLGLAQSVVLQKAREALEAVGFNPDEIGGLSPFELSGGQKRRVAIAGILAMAPEVLILDEPTAGLDPKARRELLELVATQHKAHNRTTILVSHSMEDVARYVDRILVMDGGQVKFFDTPKAVFANEETLKALGLDIPEITKIIKGLNRKGFDIPEDIYHTETLAQLIAERLGGEPC